ncbi:MAG: hypothetical protein LBF15_01665 [Candidatus Peribacteria bacterium]|nr:hypothetical protein [Candidatus Peribacteria bacterium]
MTSDSTETKAFISKLSSVVKTQERVQNLLDKENWKEALSVIVDFNKDQLLSGEENVSFHYKELQVFD